MASTCFFPLFTQPALVVYTGNIVQNRVGTVYKTQLVTMVTEPVWMAVMLVIKGNTAQHVGLIESFLRMIIFHINLLY